MFVKHTCHCCLILFVSYIFISCIANSHLLFVYIYAVILHNWHFSDLFHFVALFYYYAMYTHEYPQSKYIYYILIFFFTFIV